MSLALIALLFLAGLGVAIGQTILKKLSKTVTSASSLGLGLVLIESIAASPLLLFDAYFPHEPLAWMLAISSASAFGISRLATLKAYQTLPLGTVTLLSRLSLVVTALLAWLFLKEDLAVWNWVGISSIVFGSALLQYNPTNHAFRVTPDLIWVVWGVALGGLAAVLDKVALGSFSSLNYIWLNTVLIGAQLWLITGWRQKQWPTLPTLSRTQWFQLGVAACCNLIAFGIVAWVLQREAVSLVMPLYKIMSVLLMTGIGWWLFAERKNWSTKIIALILGCLGIWLISQ